MFFTVCFSTTAEAPVYLFVTSGVGQTIDEALIARIKSLGFAVETNTHDNLDAAAAAEAALIEDTGLCGPTEGINFGSHINHTNATVVKPDHPIVLRAFPKTLLWSPRKASAPLLHTAGMSCLRKML